MASNSSTARNAFFRELKPRCVAINNLALRSSDKKASSKELTSVIEDLSELLEAQVRKDASVLDDKLAEYIFFPLSNVLRSQQDYPAHLTEVTIKSLRILIQYGWQSKISKELSQQLLILLTFIVGGVPGKERTSPVPEELKLEALRGLTSLIKATASSASGAASLIDADAVPALGHAVTVVLDTVNGGETPDIQLEALRSLDALFAGIKDPAALATFLPGTVSSLSRLLAPPAAWKTSRKVLIQGAEVMKAVLVGVMGDVKILPAVKKSDAASGGDSTNTKILSSSWLRATADQVKLALSSVLKLRSHESEDVQHALERLCIALLDECHNSLNTCTQILVESAIILSNDEYSKSLLSSGLNTSLSDLAGIFPELVDTVKTTVYNWVTSMPRLMLSGDEEIKRQAIRNLLKGQSFMTSLRIDSSTLSDSMSASLRDSVTALVASAGSTGHLTELPSDALELSQGVIRKEYTFEFQPVLMAQATQASTRNELLKLISNGSSLLHHGKLAGDMLEYVRASTGNSQIAAYWLAFELVKSGLAQNSDLDEFLDLSSVGDPTGEHDHALHELYTFSAAILNSAEGTEEPDWRLQALALEVTTFTASRMGVDFRPELIDVLYPIATFMGSEVPQLREHTIISLNQIAAACDYSNVAELVIENVDYMVNSISLRLDTFDVSPASTQVLKMMIKLTGPKLLPFLDDVVASIFAALDNYHGYTLFAENLFSVLAEVVQQGSKSDLLLIGDQSRSKPDHLKKPAEGITVQELVGLIDRRAERKKKRREQDIEPIEDHPTSPWAKAQTEGAQDDDHGEGSRGVEEKRAPITPTYALLTKITNLTQHYLTSPSPTLRKSLLDLLVIVCPSLAPDEETFLPLVNSIWPVLLSRLHDPESFVVVSACAAVSALCSSAGDFLSTRIKTEWWEGLGKWCTKTKLAASRDSQTRRTQRVRSKDQGSSSVVMIPIRSGRELATRDPSTSLETGPHSSLGKFTQASQTWDATKEMLVAIASFVRIDDEIFTEILDLLSDDLAAMPEAKRSLEVINADAVWLAIYEKGQLAPLAAPQIDGMRFVEC